MPDALSELKKLAGHEPAAIMFGIEVIELTPGYARVAMTVRPEHENFAGGTFGGVIVSLADFAFGYAVNTLNFPSTALQFNTHFVNAPKTGDRLIAEGKVVKSGRRIGISGATIVNQDGKLIATATGTTIPMK
jgi:acyl-CoA thioesterase